MGPGLRPPGECPDSWLIQNDRAWPRIILPRCAPPATCGGNGGTRDEKWTGGAGAAPPVMWSRPRDPLTRNCDPLSTQSSPPGFPPPTAGAATIAPPGRACPMPDTLNPRATARPMSGAGPGRGACPAAGFIWSSPRMCISRPGWPASTAIPIWRSWATAKSTSISADRWALPVKCVTPRPLRRSGRMRRSRPSDWFS